MGLLKEQGSSKAHFDLKGKTISIDRRLYDELRERFFEFDENDCKAFIRPILTKGSLETGFTCPNLDVYIENTPAEVLSAVIEQGARLRRESLR